MIYVFLILVVLPVIANFADFLIGKSGDRLLRDQLVRFYVAVEGDWREIYRAPANLVSTYLFVRLGKTFFHFLLSVIAYSIILAAILTAFHIWRKPEGVDALGWDILDFSGLLTSFIVPNVIGDLISWSASRAILGRLHNANLIEALVLGAVLLGVAAFAFSVTVRLEECDSSITCVLAFTDLKDIGVSFEKKHLIDGLAELGFNVQSYTFDYWGLVPLTVGVPAGLFGLSLVTASLLVMLRPIIQKPLSILLVRIDESQRGVLTLLALAFAAIGYVILTYIKLRPF